MAIFSSHVLKGRRFSVAMMWNRALDFFRHRDCQFEAASSDMFAVFCRASHSVFSHSMFTTICVSTNFAKLIFPRGLYLPRRVRPIPQSSILEIKEIRFLSYFPLDSFCAFFVLLNSIFLEGTCFLHLTASRFRFHNPTCIGIDSIADFTSVS